jgi:hypothetical protein
MHLRNGRLLLAVNVERAKFPVLIDPLLAPYETLVGPLQPTSSFGTSKFGSVVAMSANAETVAVGGEGDDEGRGAAWIFARTGDSLAQVGAKLTPRPQSFKGRFGRSAQVTNFGASLALSANGSTLLVGDNPIGGPVAGWVFTRIQGTWRQQGPALTPPGAPEGSSNNAAVALSGNGETAVLANIQGEEYVVWSFVRAGGRWRAHGVPLGSSAPPALSGDGRTLLLGTRVFSRTRSGWRQIARLRGLYRHESVSNATLSADGETALVVTSASVSGSTHSFALFYGRAGHSWKKRERVSAPPDTGDTSFGRSVALSSDGATAVVDSPPGYLAPANTEGFASVYTRAGAADWVREATLPGIEGQLALASNGFTIFASPPNETGALAKIFTRTSAGWTEQDTVVDPNDAAGTDSSAFGESFAVSADGTTAIVAEGHDTSVFVRNGQVWSRQAHLQLEGATGEGALVALSGDGNTAVLAGFSSPGPVAAWVFTRNDGVWSTRGTP